MIRCILFPGIKLFVSSGGKQQSADIVREKVTELCKLVPALDNELDHRPGKTREGKDSVTYMFKNGSIMRNIAANERSRGLRMQGGLLEECASMDGDIINQVLIPMMNISRQGSLPDEVSNKSQIYVTTAGYKNTFAYQKLIQLLVQMVTEPGKAFVMGGTWRVPVVAHLLDRNFVADLQRDGTYNEASFDREYESRWTGSVEDAFFSSEAFDRNRILQKPEYEFSGRSSSSAYYILGMDVGRGGGKGCDSVITVLKVTPQSYGDTSLKQLVNLYTFHDMHFEDQAIVVKRLFEKYRARRIVIDANGLGAGFVDYMVKSQNDPETGEVLPPFGVEGATFANWRDEYNRYRTPDTIQNAMFLIKADAPFNTEAHTNAQVQLSSGKIKFLIDERTAKQKLLGTTKGRQMTAEQRAKYLNPYTLTSILEEEMVNLREKNEGVNIILDRANKGIKKDKFSSLEYALYYIKQVDDNKRKRKGHFNPAQWRKLCTTV